MADAAAKKFSSGRKKSSSRSKAHGRPTYSVASGGWKQQCGVWLVTLLVVAILLFDAEDFASKPVSTGSQEFKVVGAHGETLHIRQGSSLETSKQSTTIPGPILNNHIYLLGARLQTMYRDNDDSVQVVVFALPGGNFVKPKNDTWTKVGGVEHKLSKKTCISQKSNSSLLSSMWSTQHMTASYNWFVTLECATRSGKLVEKCERGMPLLYVPHRILDGNLVNTTMILRADITQYLSKQELLRLSRQAGSSDFHIRVSLWLHPVWDMYQTMNESARSVFQRPHALLDIPLDSLSVGRTIPFRQKDSKQEVVYQANALDAILCVPIYGPNKTQYIVQEFVQHHLNVGFDQIVFGLLDATNIEENAHAHVLKRQLRPYLDHDRVVLQAAALPVEDGLNCEVDLLKSFFLNSCLYHAKAHAKYVGMWDIDEYWTPPTALALQAWLPLPMDSSTIHRDTWRDDDPIWSQSKYPNYPSVSQVMQAIQVYQERHGCRMRWCFHSFGSSMVHAVRGTGLPNPTTDRHFLRDMFGVRDTLRRAYWHKSIGLTERVQVAALHEFGSCPDLSRTGSSNVSSPWLDTQSSIFFKRTRSVPYKEAELNDTRLCRSLVTYADEATSIDFGQLHHFYLLIGQSKWREMPIPYSAELVPDEYLQLFAGTVEEQLAAATTSK